MRRGHNSTSPVVWTPERVAEALSLWDSLGTSVAAAEVLSSQWAVKVTPNAIRAAVFAHGGGEGRSKPPAAPAPVERPAPPPITAPAAEGLVAVICDLHVPDHDPGCLASFERWAAVAKPVEVIIAGDFLELESASEHPGARPRTIEQDLEDGKLVMRRLLALAPRVTLREGNHSTRAARIVQHRVPSMASRFRSPLDDFAEMGVAVDTHTHSPTRRGRPGEVLLVMHGDEGHRGGSGGAMHSRKVLEMYAEPGATILYGHWHRTQHFVRPMELGNAEAYALPCMRSLNPGWLGAELSGWQQGWAAVTLCPGRRATVEVLRYEAGKVSWGGRMF